MPDKGSGTNESLPDLPYFCMARSVGPALNGTSAKGLPIAIFSSRGNAKVEDFL